MKQLLAATAAIVLCAQSLAATQAVVDYSWLQLAPDKVVPILGGVGTGNPTVHGQPADWRWGNWTWCPSDNLTGAGTGEYWAGLQLDKARNIKKVNVEMWGSTLDTAQRFYVDASNDGTGWDNIGVHEFGSFSGSASVSVPVTTTKDYQYVRVRFMPGDYTNNISNYGGPGMMMIEPIGDGVLQPGDIVNWANRPMFGTTATNNYIAQGDVRNWAGWNNGTFSDYAPWNGMNRNFLPEEYMQLDLAAARTFSNVTLLGKGAYTPGSFELQISQDGVLYTPVTGTTTLYPAGASYLGAIELAFAAPVTARYLRVTNATVRSGGYLGVTQILVNGKLPRMPGDANTDNKVDFADYLILESSYGSAPAGPTSDADFDGNGVVEFADYLVLEANFGTGAVPEPMTLSLLALGGLALLRRR